MYVTSCRTGKTVTAKYCTSSNAELLLVDAATPLPRSFSLLILVECDVMTISNAEFLDAFFQLG